MTTTAPDAAALAERMRRKITLAVRNGADLDEERAALATALGGGS